MKHFINFFFLIFIFFSCNLLENIKDNTNTDGINPDGTNDCFIGDNPELLELTNPILECYPNGNFKKRNSL